MAETIHKGGKLELLCPSCGQSVATVAQISAARPNSLIYAEGSSAGRWPPGGGDSISISCPNGCEGNIGGPADAIKEAINALAEDPSRAFAEFTLQKVE